MLRISFLSKILFTLVLSCSMIFGSYEMDWTDVLDFGVTDYGQDVTTDNSGDIFITGGGNGSTRLIKYNSATGDTIWTCTTPAWVLYGVAVDGSGNIIVAGNDWFSSTNWWWIGKYNSSGTLVWADTFNFGYGDKLCIAQDVVADASGNFCVTGFYVDNSNNDHMHTRKYNSSNSVVWQDTVHNNERAFGITLDSDGSCIITGNCITIKYSSSGDSLWGRDDGGTFDDTRGVATDVSGNIYVAGNLNINHGGNWNRDCLLSKYDPSGNSEWADTIISADGHDHFYGVTVDGSGRIVATGDLDNGTNTDYYIVEYNSSGTILWADTIDNGSDDYAQAIASYADTIIVTGYCIFSNFDYFTIKYKSFNVGIAEQSSMVNTFSLAIAPNPFSKLTKISFGKELSAKGIEQRAKLKIYDSSGRLVRQWDNTTIRQSDKISWNGTDSSNRKLPCGVYFVRLNTADKSITKKVVKLE